MDAVEHYESKRSGYMLPPPDCGLVDEFTFEGTDIPQNVTELRRSLAATITAFWQADAAYALLKERHTPSLVLRWSGFPPVRMMHDVLGVAVRAFLTRRAK